MPVKSDRLPSQLTARSNPIDDWFYEETVGPARIPPCLQQPAPYHTNTCSCPLLNALKSASLVQNQQCFCSNCTNKLNTPVCPSITDTQCPATNQTNTSTSLHGSSMDQVKPLAIASIRPGCNDCPWAPPTISTIPSSLSSAAEPSLTDHLKPASSSAYRIQFTEPCHTPRWLLTQLCSLPLATLNEMYNELKGQPIGTAAPASTPSTTDPAINGNTASSNTSNAPASGNAVASALSALGDGKDSGNPANALVGSVKDPKAQAAFGLATQMAAKNPKAQAAMGALSLGKSLLGK